MHIIGQGVRKGRKIVMGKAAYNEMDLLNKEKSFDSALDTMLSIKKTHNYLFGFKDSMRVNRSVHGTMKLG